LALANRIDAPSTIREAEARGASAVPVTRPGGRGSGFSPEQAQSFAAGAVEGAANLLTPGDVVLTLANLRAVRPLIAGFRGGTRAVEASIEPQDWRRPSAAANA
jgi:hypothetical protein